MMICPHCKAENRDSGRFCRQCGHPLEIMPAPSSTNNTCCPHCGTSLRLGVRFCKQCGRAVPGPHTSTPSLFRRCPNCDADIRSGARFCRNCGSTLTSTQTSDTTCQQCGTPLRAGSRFCKQCGAATTTPVQISASHVEPPTPHHIWETGSSSKHHYSSTGHLLPQQKIIDRYLIVEKIEEGGMGAIYRAQDLRLRSKVIALKEMSEEKIPLEERTKVLKAFEQEAELLARLRHPNLTRVTDCFEEQGRHYMVMEFIQGETLDQLLERQSQPFSEEQVLNWAGQLCNVLSFLHTQKPRPIIYRDIKPGNIMIVQDSDHVKLIDFGIARFYKPGKKKDTIPFGTEGYAPPEQYGKSQTDERADVYALGVTLHQLLTLEEPRTHLMNLPPVRDLNPHVSKRVAAAIDQALRLSKRHRHQSMVEFWEALSGEEARWTHLVAHPIENIESDMTDGSDQTISPQAPALQVMHSEIRPRESGISLVRTLQIEAGETWQLQSNADWLKVSDNKVGPEGGKVTVTIETHQMTTNHLELTGNPFKRWVSWHTSQLVPREHTYWAEITARSTGGQEECYPVAVTIRPGLGQKSAGWIGTLLAMGTEVGVAGGIVATILIAIGAL